MGKIKKALKKIEKPFRSGKTAAKKAAKKVEAREEERYQRERDIVDPALTEGQERFAATAAERDARRAQQQAAADAAIRQYQDFDQFAAAQPYQDAYTASQGQAYGDLARLLGTDARDAAIGSAGRLGALSGQRSRQLADQRRAEIEAAGALGAEAFKYGQGRADTEFDRIGQRISGIGGAGDIATRAATSDIAGHLGALKGQQADTAALNAANAARAAGAKGALHDAAVNLTGKAVGSFFADGGYYQDGSGFLDLVKNLGHRAKTGMSPEQSARMQEMKLMQLRQQYPNATDEELLAMMEQEEAAGVNLADTSIANQLALLGKVGNKGGQYMNKGKGYYKMVKQTRMVR